MTNTAHFSTEAPTRGRPKNGPPSRDKTFQKKKKNSTFNAKKEVGRDSIFLLSASKRRRKKGSQNKISFRHRLVSRANQSRDNSHHSRRLRCLFRPFVSADNLLLGFAFGSLESEMEKKITQSIKQSINQTSVASKRNHKMNMFEARRSPTINQSIELRSHQNETIKRTCLKRKTIKQSNNQSNFRQIETKT